jgi:hypothetical protein
LIGLVEYETSGIVLNTTMLSMCIDSVF